MPKHVSQDMLCCPLSACAVLTQDDDTGPHERHVYVYASPSRASSLEISIHYRNV